MKNNRSIATVSWLQIGLGIIVITYAIIRYVSHGYHWDATNTLPIVVIFGVSLPVIAAVRLLKIRQEQKKEEQE